MKKQSFITILLIVFMNMIGTKANAFDYDIRVNNADGVPIYYKYINDGNELEVRGYMAFSSCVVIPEDVTYSNRTLKVTRIGNRAFYENNALSSITIPKSVTSIGEDAFYKSKLTSVTIENGLKTIGKYAFYECSKLTSITIPNSVTTIQEKAFSCCGKLTSVTMGNSVSEIGPYAFKDCFKLASVNIPDNVIIIESYAFQNCI